MKLQHFLNEYGTLLSSTTSTKSLSSTTTNTNKVDEVGQVGQKIRVEEDIDLESQGVIGDKDIKLQHFLNDYRNLPSSPKSPKSPKSTPINTNFSKSGIKEVLENE